MIAETIFVGTELLLGQIVNTNAAYLGERLSELGIDTYYQTVVGDNPARLSVTLKAAIERSDVVITSGGLGPTMDDLTRETVAELTGRTLVLDEDIWEHIRSRRPNMPENMKRQAMVPVGAKVLPNNAGSAPGLAVPTADGKRFFLLLPGPPSELKPMFEQSGIPLLLERMGERTTLVSRSLHFCGIGESPLEDSIKDLVAAQSDPTLATYAKPGDVLLRISTKAHSQAEGLDRIKPVEEEIRRRLGAFIYGTDEATMQAAVGHLLTARGWRVATVDSFTGGALAERLAEPQGSEAWFTGGLVAATLSQASSLLTGFGTDEESPREASVQDQALQLARRVRALGAEVGVAIVADQTGNQGIIAVSTSTGITHSVTVSGRGRAEDRRWRISQTALTALREILIKQDA